MTLSKPDAVAVALLFVVVGIIIGIILVVSGLPKSFTSDPSDSTFRYEAKMEVLGNMHDVRYGMDLNFSRHENAYFVRYDGEKTTVTIWFTVDKETKEITAVALENDSFIEFAGTTSGLMIWKPDLEPHQAFIRGTPGEPNYNNFLFEEAEDLLPQIRKAFLCNEVKVNSPICSQ